MREDNWPFKDEPNVMVITMKSIVYSNKPILHISHDEEDGMWQFLDGSDVNTENAMIVSLKEMADIDPSIKDVSDLPLGCVAYREKKGDEWKKQSRSR